MAGFNLKSIVQKLKSRWEKSDARERFDKTDSRKKSRMIKLAVSAVLILLLVLVMKNRGEQESGGALPSTPGEVDLGLDTKVLQKSWYAQATDELSRQDKRLADLERRMKSVLEEVEKKAEGYQSNFEKEFDASMRQLQSEKEKAQARESRVPAVSPEPGTESTEATTPTDKPESSKAPAVAQQLPVRSAYPARPKVPQNAIRPKPQAAPQTQQPTATGQEKPAPTGQLIHMDIQTASFMDPAKSKPEAKADQIPLKQVIPIGSFFKCTLLTGVDAATGLKAQSQPQPVLLKINSLTTLPNAFKQDIQQCHITGEAYGSLSDERAYIRVNNLSCIKKRGGLINTEIRGFVTGEDGTLGLRGRMVSKKGVFLARSLVASFVEGISKAFSSAGTTTMSVWGGTETTVTPQAAFQVGFGEGMAGAMSDLAKSYRDMAKETFPVIEIGSGRQVHVVTVGETDLVPKLRLFDEKAAP